MAKTTKKIETPPVSAPQERQYVRPVVLDWNIIHYWVSEKMRSAIMPVLLDLDKANLKFTMSEISIYEAQCKMPVGQHEEALGFMQGLPSYPIDTNTHIIAAVVTSCYKDHEKTKGHAGAISLQDSFNAACAIQNNALIVTGDYEDYPMPFFDPVYHWTITSEKGHSQKIYLLVPDLGLFDAHVDNWNKINEAKKSSKQKEDAKRKGV